MPLGIRNALWEAGHFGGDHAQDAGRYLGALKSVADVGLGLGNLGLGAARLGLDMSRKPRALGLGAMGQHLGVMAGAGLLMAGGRKLMENMQLQKSYSRMLQVYPELAREDPARVQLYFDSVAQGSPATASQPLVVGSLIKRLINFDGFDHSVYKDLVAAQSTLDRGRAGFEQNAISALTSGLNLAHAYRTAR